MTTNTCDYSSQIQMIRDILLSEESASMALWNEQRPFIKFDKVTRPVIFVSIGSHAIVSGAESILSAITAYVQEQAIDADVEVVGSYGLFSLETLVEVQLPGMARVALKQIKPEDVGVLLDSVLNRFLPDGKAVFQHRSDLHQAWPNVPFFDEHPFFSKQHRVVLDLCGKYNPVSLPQYVANGGFFSFAKAIRSYTFSDICDIIDRSDLRGRAGGGFSAGKKWRMALEVAAESRYVICNADESDPGAFMNRLLLEGSPFRVLEGVALAAYASGANRAFISTRNRYSLAVSRLEEAIATLQEVGLLGENILDSGYNLVIKVKKGPGAYVCGEETALIRSLEGKRGIPSSKPPYPTTAGYKGKPTVVNNLETLANVPLILSKGPDWFRSLGTETSKGTKIFALSGKCAETCVVEVEMGTSLNSLLDLAGGMAGESTLKAIQIGGPSGACIPPSLMALKVDFEELKENDIPMGNGGILVYDEKTCIPDMVKFFMGFIQNESCGKCIPCREGSQRMLEIYQNITRRPVTEEGHNTLERFKGVIQLEGLAEVMKDTSACGLGQTSTYPVLTTLKYFREEYEEHIFDRHCRAGVCKDLRVYQIDLDKCTGCTACVKKCPVNAIAGSPRMPHYIVLDKCIACGVCLDTCMFGAVVTH
ncbi:MAG TPA: NADH-ubiquinone oxidoreductase-F iron-sulfur binding region domain-containing protein [Williamwhitmania sp.]|nr:NADH-ubiquinone oxidoreductase-F iron-sulfur binding region domain-containing protein [Williamwhitmania sp.]